MKDIISYSWIYIAMILGFISFGYSIWFCYPRTNVPVAIVLVIVAMMLIGSAIWVHTDNNIKYKEEKRRKEIRENISNSR